MNILTTGAGGFLGSFFTKYLEERGHSVSRVTSSQCDLRVPGSLQKRYSGQDFDAILHLAAWTQAGDFCMKFPGQQWINNQLINTNVLQWWNQEQRGAKLVFMGTSCVYAPDSTLREETFMIGEPIDSLYTYAMTKRMLYQGAKALAKEYGQKYICLVPSTLYGPGYHTDGRQMHFIFDLIRKIIRGKEFGEEVVLWGNGHQRREVVHVEDFCKIGYELMLGYENEIFNIGAGVDYTIREFASKICKTVGYDESLIQYDETKYTGATSKLLDTSKTNAAINMPVSKALEQGIRETVDWFYANNAYRH